MEDERAETGNKLKTIFILILIGAGLLFVVGKYGVRFGQKPGKIPADSFAATPRVEGVVIAFEESQEHIQVQLDGGDAIRTIFLGGVPVYKEARVGVVRVSVNDIRLGDRVRVEYLNAENIESTAPLQITILGPTP